MSDIIDINVAQTVEEVTINVVDNVIQVNINQVNGGGGIESVVAGTNITVDNTDPLNPIINANADAVTSVNSDTGAVIVDLESVLNEGNESTLGQGIQSLIIKGGDTYRDLVDDEMSIVTFGTASSVREISFGWLDDSIAFRKDYESGVGGVYKLLSTNGGVRNISFTPDIKTTSFTAVNENNYTANGTLTVTDPTPIANKGYIVHVIGGTSTIGGVGYTSGALVYRYYDGSGWISTNMNNAITIDATPTDGSSNAVSSNGVFDALALKETTIFDNVGGSVVNVDSTPTIIYTFPISADTFNNTTLAEISFAIERLGTGSPTSLTVGMYASTSNVTLGNLFASYANSSTTRLTFSFVRRFKISSNLLDPFEYPVGFGQLSNIGAIATGGTPTTISFNPTVQMYIHIVASHTTVAGNIQVIGSKLNYIK